MSTLVVIGYDDMQKAQQMRHDLVLLEEEYLVDLEDAVVVVRDAKGKVKLHQVVSLPTVGALQGGMWGALIGCLFLNPIFGMTLGAAAGAMNGALSDIGINDDFMKELGQTLKPGTSALCVLIRQMTEDKVLEHLAGTGGKLLKSNLSHEDEAKLQAAISAAQKEQSTAVGAKA